MTWPSAVVALVAYLRAETGVQVGTKVPGNLEALPRFIRVARGPGSDDLVTDSTLIDIEVFAPVYADAEALAEEVRQTMHRLSGRKAGSVLVDRVRTSTSPMWVDYKNPATNRFVASYRFEYRQVPA